jgi:acetoin utilization deacetylase AcuC-like enzyme
MTTTKRWLLTWFYRDDKDRLQQGRLEADDYSWLHEQAMKLKAEGCISIFASKQNGYANWLQTAANA